MQIRKAVFLDPGANHGFAIAAVAVSLFAFAYSTRFGPIAILAFYACWLPVFLIEPQVLLRGLGRALPLLILPGFAAFSVLWSDRPEATLRGAIQYGSTIFCGLVAARLVPIPTLALGGLAGSVVILAYSFMNGHYAYDVVDGSYTFAGAFSSKNQLGFFASLALIFAIATVWLFQARLLWRLLAVGVGAFAVVALVMADSATSTLTVIGALLVVVIARALFALAPGTRRVGIALVLLLAAGGVAIAWQAGAFETILEVFGKDTTLTGRTYLWQRGIEIGDQRPLAGLGYYAFWNTGRPDAEELWREFYIEARTGFHFHNTLIEAYVGLGLLGITMILVLILFLLLLPLRVLMNRQLAGSAIVCSGLSILFVVRSLVEIDFFTPYTAGSFLVPYLILQMADQRHFERQAARPPRPTMRLQEGGVSASSR